ncbi:hypothetical protein N7507_003055 [Penicillium longicatenatum]|nr:hypothetical protein N7507_003055 [Penicillium longicatenatum]
MTSINFGNGNTSSGTQVGINHGVINLRTEQLKPRTTPLSTVPFPPDPDFVSRDQILDQIRERASIPKRKIVLVGLGGVGKTQLAIEYAHQVRRQSPETWVFWIHASNAARCEKSLRDLASRVNIPGHQERNVDIFQVFGNWLQDEEIGKWILILDNVDDDGLLRKPSSTNPEGQSYQITNQGNDNSSTQPPLRPLLQSSNGFIIVTSRNRRVGLEIAGHRNLIEVQPMEKPEALDLLQKKLGIPAGRDSMERLVEALELMPLAIIQAANYITHRPHYSVSQYLEKLQKSDRAAMRLLDYEAGLLSRDWDAKNSILLTWQISFDYIQDVNPSAADLLSLMSFFDRQGIQKSVLRIQQTQEIDDSSDSKMARDSSSDEDSSDEDEYEDEDGDEDEDEDEVSSKEDSKQSFEDDVIMLSDYSLIAIGESNKVLTMHRLVQLTVRTWLKTRGQLEHWKEKFINNLNHEFPTGNYEDWKECRSLLPHQPESNDCLRQWASLLFRAAWYMQEAGNYAESIKLAIRSRKQRLKDFGEEDEETLASSTQLGKAYWLEGQFKEAEDLQAQVMEVEKKKLGADHPNTLVSINNLASMYADQGRWKEAEELQAQVTDVRKTKLGADHPDTLTSINNLASIYTQQGRWKEAEELQVQVMEVEKTKLGADHPDTLTSINNLASIYTQQGRWKEAEELQAQVMEVEKIKLGADHPNTLVSINNLASMYADQGRWKEAEELQAQVTEVMRTKFGADHPDTLTSINNLAWTYARQGRWTEAEELQVQVMEVRKTKLGADHPNTLVSINNLASMYADQGRWKEAEELQAQVTEVMRTKFGADHPDTLTSINNLAWTYARQGRWTEAEELQVQVMEVMRTKLGADHPNTLVSINNLASMYADQGRWKEAEELQVQAMEIRKTKLGVDHPDTLVSMSYLAIAYKHTNRHAEAVNMLKVCVNKQRRILGPAHPSTVVKSKMLLEWETEVSY